jgi:hypothetical protein
VAKHVANLYVDLVEPSDVEGQQLVADLHAFFQLAVPARLRVAPVVTPRPAGAARWRWSRFALVGALAIFVLVGATYLALPLLQSLWSEDRGLQHVTQAGLARELNLRQTIDGVTVHVQKGYADANRVAIGYSVEFPATAAADEGPPLGLAVLTDDKGRTYRSLGFSTTGNSPLGALVHYFEPLGVTGARDIAFTLTIPEVVRTPRGSGTVQTFRGPWVFNFTLPMAAARVVEPALTVTRPGVELTFTRIVVAPSATRFDYRLHVEGFTDREGARLLLLSGRGGGSAPCWPPAEECFVLVPEPLFDADAVHVDAVILIPDLEPCPPRQICVVGRDGKPLQIRIDGLVLPLR